MARFKAVTWNSLLKNTNWNIFIYGHKIFIAPYKCPLNTSQNPNSERYKTDTKQDTSNMMT